MWALFALREDYLAPLDPYTSQVPTHPRTRYRMDLLTLASALEAIVRPAVDRVWTAAAADQLIRDLATIKTQQPDGTFVEQTGAYVEPMQLQVVCRGLWEKMPADDRSVDPADVAAFGDVTRALGNYYADELARIAAGDESAPDRRRRNHSVGLYVRARSATRGRCVAASTLPALADPRSTTCCRRCGAFRRSAISSSNRPTSSSTPRARSARRRR